MKGFLKKSVRSIRKPKIPDNAGGAQESRACEVDTPRDIGTETTQGTDEETVASSEINTVSGTRYKNKEKHVGAGDNAISEPTRHKEISPEANSTKVEISLPLSEPEIARKDLLLASRELENILCLYFSSDNT